MLKPAVVLRGVTFDQNGLAICAGRAGTCGTSDKPDDPISFVASAAPGEPLRFAFIASDDPKLRAVSSTVPTALRSTDKGCTIEAVLLTPRAEVLVIVASGFPPGANLKMHSDSEGEVVEASPKADADGAYTTALLPAKKGLLKGTVKIRLSANQCAPELQIPWAIAPAVAQ